jgi:drug/metabolite transporter (DMT)-like permease
MLIYLVLAVLASTLMALGLLMMKSRATSLPDARGARVISGVLAWLRDPMWTGGMFVQIAGWGLYVTAVSQAPVSMVAVMMQGGIALFVIFSVVVLGERARAAEWAGIIAIVVGMILLSLSLSAGASQGATDGRTVIALSVGLVVIAAASFTRPRLAHNGTAQAISSGIAFGLGSMFTKAMTDSLEVSSTELVLRILTDPWIYAMVAANLSGMIMLQNSFHQARGIITMPLSGALSNLVPIAGGMLAFGERLPSDPIAATMRIAAFVLTIAASTTLAVTEEERLASEPEQRVKTAGLAG